MKSSTAELEQIIHKLSEKAYGQPGAAGGPGGFDPSSMAGMGGQPGAAPTSDAPEEDVVDVDFEDVE